MSMPLPRPDVPGEIRANVVRIIASALARYRNTKTSDEPATVRLKVTSRAPGLWETTLAAIVGEALADAGLLPTGEQFGVGGDAEPCCIHEDGHAARLDQAAHGGPLRHRWTHPWREVPDE